MGLFSWTTCDTNVSIPHSGADHPRAGDTVYLLQPNGYPPIGGAYDGYGNLGDVDVYRWLARQNGQPDTRDAGRMLDTSGHTLHYPLKFSYNPDARYEDWPPSQQCPYQGHFYPDASAGYAGTSIPILLEVANPTAEGYSISHYQVDAKVIPGLVVNAFDTADIDRDGIVLTLEKIPFVDRKWIDEVAREGIELGINEDRCSSGLHWYDTSGVDSVHRDPNNPKIGYIAYAVNGTKPQHDALDLPWPPATLDTFTLDSGDENEALASLRPHLLDGDRFDPETGIIGVTGHHWSVDYPVVAAQVTVWHTGSAQDPGPEPPQPL